MSSPTHDLYLDEKMKTVARVKPEVRVLIYALRSEFFKLGKPKSRIRLHRKAQNQKNV